MYVYYDTYCEASVGVITIHNLFFDDQIKPSDCRMMVPPFTWDCDDPYGR